MNMTEGTQIFELLSNLKIRAGETLCASYFKQNAQTPSYVITQKGLENYILYRLEGIELVKEQSSGSLKTLDQIASEYIK